MFNKISWSEENKSVKVTMSCIAKVSTVGIDEIFAKVTDEETRALIKDIEEVNFRINDENIQDDIDCERDAFTYLYVKEEGMSAQKRVIGASQVLRLTLCDIALDMTDCSKQS